MRSIAPSLVVARPTGVRIRTRLRVGDDDDAVLRAVGEQLGRLAGSDLTTRCMIGHGDAQRARRKRALTPRSSSRWAGAITRTSNDQWTRGFRNLLDERASLRRRLNSIDRRLAVPVGERTGRVRGYASQGERWAKQQRRQRLAARLTVVEARIATGRVGVVRGGRQLARVRHRVQASRLTVADWRERWQAARLFLTADGEAAKAWGNETIRWHPEQHWLELKLPASLVQLANQRHGRYRLDCPVAFTHRAGEVAAQAATGAVRYDIWFDATRRRWYLDASWRLAPALVPLLQELGGQRRLAVDLNAGHLACWVLTPDGNPLGRPHTIPLALAGLPTATRDGRVRAAISQLLAVARTHDCQVLAVEDLDFTDARQLGREGGGRGRRGRRFRRTIAEIPIRAFRDRLVQMAHNRAMWVVAVDPAYTSTWGGRYWRRPLQQTRPKLTVTRHHAAAVVIGRRSLGHRARRRPGVPRPHRWMGEGELPARPVVALVGCQGPGPPTRPASSTTDGAQDWPGQSEGIQGPGPPRPFGRAGQDEILFAS